MRILAFTAHPDDEINCAGLILKCIKKGGHAKIVCFTKPNKIRVNELKKSCKTLGAELLIFPFKDRGIIVKKGLRLNLIKIIREFKPEIVIAQSLHDYHPDHKVVSKLAREAVEFASHGTGRKAWIVKTFLEMETGNLFSSPDIIIDVTETFNKKMEALNKHASEILASHKKGYYQKHILLKSLLRGLQSGVKYGEAFKIINQPVLGDFYPHPKAIKDIEVLI